MAYEMSLTLTDEEYAKLQAESAQSGKPVELVAHELLARQLYAPNAPTELAQALTSREFTERQYREGKVLNLPTREPLTPQEAAERERRAHLLSGGKSASDIVIEDRGPR